MPTITVPLQPWTDIAALKKSKRFKELAAEKLSLQQQEKKIRARYDGDPEQGIESLNTELYLILDQALPDGVKSIEFEGYDLAKVDTGESSSFDKQALMQRPLPCSECSECKRKKVVVFVTVADIDACAEKTARKPTVRATKIKSRNSK